MSNSSSKGSVFIIDPETGAPKEWKRLSARNQELLAAYPPKDGWGVVISAAPAQLQLVTAAGPAVTVTFTATMTSPTGQVVAAVSALATIDSPDAWAIGESRARHRLCEALGFGGEVQDDDERVLVESRGGQVAPAAPAAPTAKAAKVAKVAKAAAPADDQQPASAMLLRQIADRARQLGVPAPECATQAQAKAAWKALLTAPPTGGP